MTTQVKIENVNGPNSVEVRVVAVTPPPANEPDMVGPDTVVEMHLLVPGSFILTYVHNGQYLVTKEIGR